MGREAVEKSLNILFGEQEVNLQRIAFLTVGEGPYLDGEGYGCESVLEHDLWREVSFESHLYNLSAVEAASDTRQWTSFLQSKVEKDYCMQFV